MAGMVASCIRVPCLLMLAYISYIHSVHVHLQHHLGEVFRSTVRRVRVVGLHGLPPGCCCFRGAGAFVLLEVFFNLVQCGSPNML